MRKCAPDNFACLFDTAAGTLGTSPMALAIAIGVAFVLTLILTEIFH